MGREDSFGRNEREVVEVLMVNCVELILGDQAHEVRELDGNDATGLQEDLHARDAVVDVGDLGQHIGPE